MLAIGVEEALGGQLFLQLAEGQFEGTDAPGSQLPDDQLVLSTWQVDLDPTASDDLESVGEFEWEPRGGVSPDDCRDLGLVVLESEVDVAGARGAAVGDLTGDSHVGIVILELVLDLAGQFRDGSR